MNFERWFRERASSPTSSLERDASDNRLVKQENGMVLLPRTFYNKHPAKAVAQRRTSARLFDTPPKKKSPPKKKQSRDVEPRDAVYECEYRLVFCDPHREPVEAPPANTDFTLKNLSELIDTERLPSSMWEVERIPPLINFQGKTDSSYDAIAAELEELMGESKKPEEEKMEVEPAPPELEVVADKPAADAPQDPPAEPAPKSETEKVQDDYPSIMDILNEIPKEPSAEPVQIKSNDADGEPEKAAEPQIEQPDDRPAETDVADEPTEEARTDSAEKSDDVVENKLEIDVAPVTDSTSEQIPNENDGETDEREAVEAEEDAPEAENLDTPMEVESSVEIDSVAEETLPALESEVTIEVDVPTKTELENNNDDYLLKSVIFRRLTEDKQTYDRLVTFQENMEYFIAINDRKVELLGAPEFITSIDDLQILLQIVDDVTLNSFNVICMS
ncbi:uncharacterized protein LOC143915955 [Arctopsyche grandis]|uniref:uncharacterized protein LOC143915955 n=1 Tax=Arctopsyche grandis TaxID=121162 RepID=UPI00406D9476